MTWIVRQMLITGALLIFTVLFFEFSHLDLIIQDQLYNFETGKWLLDSAEPISKFLFYDGIRVAYILGGLGLTIALVFFGKAPPIKAVKQGLVIVCISMYLIPLMVNILKENSDIPCPRDLVHYGGDYPHVTILSGYPADFQGEPNVECYPAGHASGGFALLSLFFVFKNPRRRRIAITCVLILSWTVGNYKMIIGDHFISHTFVTMFLSWLLILFTASFVNPRFRHDETSD